MDGGTVAQYVSREVTHLICCRKHSKKNGAMGKASCNHKSHSIVTTLSLLNLKVRWLRAVKVVSFNGSEDTLMKDRPTKELEYLRAPLVKCAVDIKGKKKDVRKENIEKGSN